MRKIILVLVMLAVAATVWAGVTTTMTCDECGKAMKPDKLCSRYSYYVIERVDVEVGNFSCLDYRPPFHMMVCSVECLKAHYCKDEDEGPPDGIMLIPGDVIDFSDLNEADLTMPYTPGIDAKDITK